MVVVVVVVICSFWPGPVDRQTPRVASYQSVIHYDAIMSVYSRRLYAAVSLITSASFLHRCVDYHNLAALVKRISRAVVLDATNHVRRWRPRRGGGHLPPP